MSADLEPRAYSNPEESVNLDNAPEGTRVTLTGVGRRGERTELFAERTADGWNIAALSGHSTQFGSRRPNLIAESLGVIQIGKPDTGVRIVDTSPDSPTLRKKMNFDIGKVDTVVVIPPQPSQQRRTR